MRFNTPWFLGLWPSSHNLQLKPEANNKLHFLPIRFSFINVYTYHNPKPTPHKTAKTVIIVVQWQRLHYIDVHMPSSFF